MRKHKAQQTELGWVAEPFALVQEEAPDFERLAREKEQAERDRTESQSKQLSMFEQRIEEKIGEACSGGAAF